MSGNPGTPQEPERPPIPECKLVPAKTDRESDKQPQEPAKARNGRLGGCPACGLG